MRPNREITRNRERGATVLLFTFCTFLLIVPMIGLAIDGSIAMWTKAKLSAAVDAAALAAGRSVSVSGNLQQEQSAATTVAQEWFAANFPSGWLNTSVVSGPTVNVQQSGKTITASVSASVQAPLFFMRIFGSNFQNVTVSASAQSSRRNLVLILVLDRSGSMSTSGACPTMIADAQSFVNYFTDGFDELGLITFSSSANLDYSPTLYFKSSSPSLSSTIGQIACTGATATTQALNLAYTTMQQVNEPGALNVIVLFTDGQPNAINASWPVRTSAHSAYYRYAYNASYSSQTVNSMPVFCTSTSNISGSMTVAGFHGGVIGQTWGIYNPSPQGITQGSVPPVSAPGCSFDTYHSGYVSNNVDVARQDIAYIPSTDAYGNSTLVSLFNGSAYKPVDMFPSGDGYAGYPRVDEQENGIVAASFNSADNQAYKIRHDSTFTPIIFTIGLGGAPDAPIDQDFLERIANDPRGSSYESTLAAGTFAYAPNASQLQMAFYQIASEILRLSQ